MLYGGWSFSTLDPLKVNGPLYQRIVQSKDLIADVLPPPEYIIESYLVSLQLVSASGKTERDRLVERLKALKKDYDERHFFWSRETLEPELAELLLKSYCEPAMAFYSLAFDQLGRSRPATGRPSPPPPCASTRAYESHRAAQDEAGAKDSIRSALTLLLLILVGSVGVCLGVAWLITRSTLGPLNQAVSVVKTFAAGDLRTQFNADGRDEFAQLLQALQEMQAKLVTVVSVVREGSNQVAVASAEIAQGNRDLSNRTESQASEVRSLAGRSAEAAREIKALFTTSVERVAQGSQLIDRAGNTMTEVVASIQQVTEAVTHMGQATQQNAALVKEMAAAKPQAAKPQALPSASKPNTDDDQESF